MTTVQARATDRSLLLGTWRNTNPSPSFLKGVVMTEKQGKVWLRVFGASDLTPQDWGESSVVEFSDNPESEITTGYTTRFDLEAISSTLIVYLNKGVMVAATLTRFKDGRHSNLFVKEFFHRIQQ